MRVDGGQFDVRVDLPGGVEGELVADVVGVATGARAQELAARVVEFRPQYSRDPPEEVEVRGKGKIVPRVDGEKGMGAA